MTDPSGTQSGIAPNSSSTPAGPAAVQGEPTPAPTGDAQVAQPSGVVDPLTLENTAMKAELERLRKENADRRIKAKEESDKAIAAAEANKEYKQLADELKKQSEQQIKDLEELRAKAALVDQQAAVLKQYDTEAEAQFKVELDSLGDLKAGFEASPVYKKDASPQERLKLVQWYKTEIGLKQPNKPPLGGAPSQSTAIPLGEKPSELRRSLFERRR